MKTYKFLALVASAVVLTVNFALADNVSLKNNNNELVGSASDMSLLPTLHDGYTIVVNNSYNVDSSFRNNFLNINSNSITIEADAPVTIQGNGNSANATLFLYSSNPNAESNMVSLTLKNLTMTQGYGAAGVAQFSGDSYSIKATNVTLSNNSSSENGGAFNFNGSAVFEGVGSYLTFTGNQSYVSSFGAEGNPNDIFSSGSITFKDAGTYILNGGISTTAPLFIQDGVNVTFGSGAVNVTGNLNISGVDTKATFASGSDTTLTGKTTIKNTSEDNIRFDGTQSFKDVVVSDGGNVTFAGTNTSTGTVTITGSDTKAHFDGAQQLSTVKVTNKAEADITPINKFTQSGIYVDDFGKLEINGDFNVDGQSTKVEVGKNGVVDLLWADQEEIFNSDLIINGGGSVNLSNTTGNLNVTGTIDGEASGALNLAIMKSAMTADSETNLYGVTGNTLTVKALGDGNDYIDLRASDFAYHEESQMYELINLTNGQLTLGEFLQAVQLPFSWFGSVVKDDYTFIDQDLSAAGSKFYVFKVDGDKVPEPSTWALLILGVAGLYLVRRKNLAK